jgi:hypothetical protein
MNDFTVIPSADHGLMQFRLAYLVEKIRVVNQAIDNSMPDEALLELRRTQQAIDGWKDEN